MWKSVTYSDKHVTLNTAMKRISFAETPVYQFEVNWTSLDCGQNETFVDVILCFVKHSSASSPFYKLSNYLINL